jgi:hypothetical protein
MLHALPPSYRRRALVQVEALIAQAERDLTRHDATRTGKTKAEAKTKTEDRLQRERRRLALLHRSRQFLLSDEFSRVKAGRR